MGYAIYCRISSDRTGESAGVTRQETECRNLAEHHGITVAEVYTDNDISAFSGATRPAYEMMLQDIRDRKIDGIICWHVDRLYRRTRDLEEIVDLVEKTGIQVRTVNAGDLDLNTATGRVTARMVAAIANYEVDHQIERQRSSQTQRAAAGKYRGGPILYGYKMGDTPGTLALSHPHADHVRDMADMVLAGSSLLAVTRKLKESGTKFKGRTEWTARHVRNILLSPTIAAISVHNGQEVGPAQWPAIVTEDEFRALQGILTDPARKTTQGNEKKWQGSGVYQCGRCGAKMRVKLTNSVNQQRGYRCMGCGRVYRAQHHVDGLIDKIILGYLNLPENRLTIIDQSSQGGEDVAALVTERGHLVERKNRLGSLFAEGAIDEAQLTAGTTEIGRQVDALDRRITAAREDSPLLELVLGADELEDRWRHLSADKRGQIIDTLIEVTIMPGSRGRRFDPSTIKIEWKS